MVNSFEKIVSPLELSAQFPLSDKAESNVLLGRSAVEEILDGKDSRKILIVGPCSIHDVDEAVEYAEKLRGLAEDVKDKYFILMRVYFEKPRTTLGWKGLVYDPDMDGSDDIEKGLGIARELLLKLNGMGIFVATEFLDPIVSEYLGDLVVWGAVGARTAESQIHRQMASRLLMPIGFKNGTSGDFDLAINAIESAGGIHDFLGVGQDGFVSKVVTSGNKYGHIILRGGSNGPNYSASDISRVREALAKRGLKENVIVDCSHANSGKDFRKQGDVFREVVLNDGVVGLMLESNLFEGSQKISKNLQKGVSVTDACIGFEETEKLILERL